MATEYRFRIDGLDAATLPMARLAEYMADLSRLLGEVESVHFSRIEPGSVTLVQSVDAPAMARVEARLRGLASGNAAPDAGRAFASLNRRLAQDEATAVLEGVDPATQVHFPGCEQAAPPAYGGFRQQGSLDGVLVRIGGKDETVHATLQDGQQTWRCELTRELARELRAHLYETPIRVFGDGRWRRDAAGKWQLEQFRITHFERLDDAGWPATVARLRAIKGAEWQQMDDPLKDLRALREGDDPAGR